MQQPPVDPENPQEMAVFVPSILQTLEASILPSLAAKEFFQKYPFAFPLIADQVDEEEVLDTAEARFAENFVTQVIFPFLTLKEKSDHASFLMSLTPAQARHMWVHQGLGALVHQAHNLWRAQHVQRIQKAVDTFLQVETKKSHRLQKARELFAVSEAGSPNRYLFLPSLQSLLRSMMPREEPQALEHGASLSAAFLHKRKLSAGGGRIRDLLSVLDEAFLLLVLRKHLAVQFGPQVQFVIPPRGDVSPTCTIASTLPLMPGLSQVDEVAVSNRLELADVAYYHQMCEKLDMEDALQEDCVWVHLFSGGPAVVEPDNESTCSDGNKRKKSSSASSRRNKRSRYV